MMHDPMPTSTSPDGSHDSSPAGSSYAEPDPLAFASLLVSKMCHDIISPVGASSSAMEMWVDSKDEATRDVAVNLMQKSSAQAVKKLEFVRLAYGAYGDVGGDIDLGEAQQIAQSYFSDDRTSLDWGLERIIVPKVVAKLALGLLDLAKEAIPRGGAITLTGTDLTGKAQLTVEAKAAKVIIPRGAEDALSGRFSEGIHARNVALYHLMVMAREVGVSIEPALGDGSISFRTVAA